MNEILFGNIFVAVGYDACVTILKMLFTHSFTSDLACDCWLLFWLVLNNNKRSDKITLYIKILHYKKLILKSGYDDDGGGRRTQQRAYYVIIILLLYYYINTHKKCSSTLVAIPYILIYLIEQNDWLWRETTEDDEGEAAAEACWWAVALL